MGKSLVIKGADFSGVAVENVLDFTQNVPAANKWFPQNTIQALYSSESDPNGARSCVCRFDVTSIQGYEDYSKIRLTVRSGFDYVFAIGDSTNVVSDEHWQRITGNGTHDSIFNWVTDNQQAIGEIKRYINVNIKFDDGVTNFPQNAKIEDYLMLELISG